VIAAAALALILALPLDELLEDALR